MSINHNIFTTKNEEQNEIRTDSKGLSKEQENTGLNMNVYNGPVMKDLSEIKTVDKKADKETQNKLRMDLYASDIWRTENRRLISIPGKTALKTSEFKKRFSNQWTPVKRRAKQKNVKSRLYQKIVNYNTLFNNLQRMPQDKICDNASKLFEKYNVEPGYDQDYADITQFITEDPKEIANEDIVRLFLANRDEEGNIDQNSARMALVKMAEQLFDFDINALHLDSDTELIRDAAKLERLSAQLGAFDRLAKKYDFFRQLTNEKKNELITRISTLRTISAYYLVKKELILNPLYKERYDYELSFDEGAATTEEEKHVAKLLMKANILGRKLVSQFGSEVEIRKLTGLSKPVIKTNSGKKSYEDLNEEYGPENDIIGLQKIINGAYKSMADTTSTKLQERQENNEIRLNDSLVDFGKEQRISVNLKGEEDRIAVFAETQMKTILTSDELTPLKGTKEMAVVRNNIEALQTVMKEQMPGIELDKDGAVDEEKEAQAKKVMDSTCTIVTVLYQRISESVKKLVSKYGEAYPELNEMLLGFVEQNNKEKDSFREKMLEFRSLMLSDPEFAAAQDKSWYSVCKYNRGVYYDLDNDKSITYKTDGAKASLLYRINKDGKTVYFRKNDYVPSIKNEELVDDVLKDIEVNQEIRDALRKLFVAIPKNGRALNTIAKFVVNEKNAKKSPVQIAEDFMVKYGLKNEKKENIVIPDKEKEQLGTAIVEYVDALHKRNMANEIAHSPKIAPKRNLSDRNVATSRLANFLGMSSIICDSRTATIKMNGKLIEGNLMEGSGGEETDNDQNPIPYTMNAMSQIFMVHIFDYMCGQTDRHFGNFHGVIKDGKIVGIKCFDNDMSFGLLKTRNIKNEVDIYYKKYNQLRPLCTELLKGMPAGFANKILGLDRKFLEQLLGDILDEKELDALVDRIDFIKSEIKAVTMGPKNNAKWVEDKYQKKIVYEKEDADDELRMLKAIKGLKRQDSWKEDLFEERCLLYYRNIEKMGGINSLITQREEELKREGGA